MPPKKRTRRSEPKLFRCTGFGDCNMVFTRSEHLARHARKHTGEKPFKCIVPGCERMFSRFDNMMQHTHTHDRQKKKTTTKAPASPSARHESLAATATMLQSRTLPPPSRPHDDPLRSPPPTLPRPASSLASPPSPMAMTLPPPPPQQPGWSHPAWHAGAGGPLMSPYSPSAHSSLTDYFAQPEHGGGARRPSWSHTTAATDHWHPYQGQPAASDYWSQFRYPSPTQQATSLSPQQPPKRRLSLIDLQTPIDHWQERSSSGSSGGGGGLTSDEDNDETAATPVVDVTSDEYEAIQGFGKFHAQSVIKPESPHMAVQVNAFRQTTLPVPESFQRPARADWVA